MAEFAAGPGDSTGADDKYVGVKACMAYSKYLSNNREARRRSPHREPSPPPPRDSSIPSDHDEDGEEMGADEQASHSPPEKSPAPAAAAAEPVVASDWLGRLAHKVSTSAAFAALKHVLVKMQEDDRMTVTGDREGRVFRDGEDCGLTLTKDLVRLVKSLTAPLTPSGEKPPVPESLKRVLKLLKVWKFAPARWRERQRSVGDVSKKRKSSPTAKNDESEAKRKRTLPPGNDDDWYKL